MLVNSHVPLGVHVQMLVLARMLILDCSKEEKFASKLVQTMQSSMFATDDAAMIFPTCGRCSITLIKLECCPNKMLCLGNSAGSIDRKLFFMISMLSIDNSK